MDSSIERSLFSRTPILLNKERDLLNGFNNDSVVELELDAESASTLVSSELSFSRTLDEKNMFDSKWELATLGNARNLYPPGFEKAEKVIEEELRFRPNLWQINGLLDVKNGYDTVVLAGTRSRKSLLFQTLSIIKKNIIVLVIMPILALMEDQFQSIKE